LYDGVGLFISASHQGAIYHSSATVSIKLCLLNTCQYLSTLVNTCQHLSTLSTLSTAVLTPPSLAVARAMLGLLCLCSSRPCHRGCCHPFTSLCLVSRLGGVGAVIHQPFLPTGRRN
jgi:hypothetical protein